MHFDGEYREQYAVNKANRKKNMTHSYSIPSYSYFSFFSAPVQALIAPKLLWERDHVAAVFVEPKAPSSCSNTASLPLQLLPKLFLLNVTIST